MEQVTLLIIGIIVLFLCLIGTVLMLILYSGVFQSVDVGAGPSPVSNLKVMYKFGKGPYKSTGEYFTETTAIAPNLRCFGVYYDDPKVVPDHKLRWAVGSIVAEGLEEPDASIVTKFQDNGYKSAHFPAVANVVKASFPQRTQLSILLGIYKVYPELARYIKDHKLCAHPYLEVYNGETIHFLAPLSKQEEFYVPEMHTGSAEHFCEPDESSESREHTGSPDTFQKADPSIASQLLSVGQTKANVISGAVTSASMPHNTQISSEAKVSEEPEAKTGATGDPNPSPAIQDSIQAATSSYPEQMTNTGVAKIQVPLQVSGITSTTRLPCDPDSNQTCDLSEEHSYAQSPLRETQGEVLGSSYTGSISSLDHSYSFSGSSFNSSGDHSLTMDSQTSPSKLADLSSDSDGPLEAAHVAS